VRSKLEWSVDSKIGKLIMLKAALISKVMRVDDLSSSDDLN